MGLAAAQTAGLFKGGAPRGEDRWHRQDAPATVALGPAPLFSGVEAIEARLKKLSTQVANPTATNPAFKGDDRDGEVLAAKLTGKRPPAPAAALVSATSPAGRSCRLIVARGEAMPTGPRPARAQHRR